MSRQRTFTLLILGLALVFGVLIGLLAVFGGGGSDLTLSEYFKEIEPIISGIDDRSEAQVVNEPAQAFALWALVLDFTAKDLRDIDPPALVARDHRDLVDAFSEGALRMKALGDLYPVVETLEEAERLINDDEDAKAIDSRAVIACQALRQVAEDNGFDIRLEYC